MHYCHDSRRAMGEWERRQNAKLEKIEGENFYDIQVKFTQDYKNLVHVYVVKNIFKNEQLKLESETVEDHG